MRFISPTLGPMNLDTVFRDIVTFINSDPDSNYRLIIGTDSHSRDGVAFVTAIIIHRTGRGARYYYHKKRHPELRSLRQRIFYEASMSLTVAAKIAQKLADNPISHLDLEIHLDVGPRGETRELIREVTGMIMGSGFDAKIKPDSYGASKVADKHTK